MNVEAILRDKGRAVVTIRTERVYRDRHWRHCGIAISARSSSAATARPSTVSFRNATSSKGLPITAARCCRCTLPQQ